MKKILLFCYLSAKEYILLYHFLKHYKKLGVTEFHLTIDCHNDENLKQRAGEITKDYHTVNTFVNKYTSELKEEAVNNFIKKYHSSCDWFVYVDLDEFINLEQSKGIDCKNLSELACILESENIKSIRGVMCDKVNPHNISTKLSLDIDISESFSDYYPVSSILVRANLNKNPFFSGGEFYFLGSHGSRAFNSYYLPSKIKKYLKDKFIVLDHYKWHEDSVEKLKDRLEIYGDSFTSKSKHHSNPEGKVSIYKKQLGSLIKVIEKGYYKKLLTKDVLLNQAPLCLHSWLAKKNLLPKNWDNPEDFSK